MSTPARVRIEAATGVAAGTAIASVLGLVALTSTAWTFSMIGLLAIESTILLANLDKNRGRAGTLYPSLGAANWTTMIRGWLLAAIGGLAVVRVVEQRSEPLLDWAPAILYTVALVLDYVDGYLARRSGRESQLGRVLENELDSLGVLIVTVYLVVGQRTPVAILVVGLARYLFVVATRTRMRRGRPVMPLRHSQSGRVIAGLTMGYLGAALWPFIPARYLFWTAPVFLIPFTASFIRDWLAVSGRIDVGSPGYRRLAARTSAALFRIAPIVLRVAAAVGAASLAMSADRDVTWIAVLLAGSIVVGLAARLTALGLVCFLAIIATTGAVSIAPWIEATLVLASVLTIGCGSGPLASWTPESRIFAKREPE